MYRQGRGRYFILLPSLFCENCHRVAFAFCTSRGASVFNFARFSKVRGRSYKFLSLLSPTSLYVPIELKCIKGLGDQPGSGSRLL